MSLTLQGMTAFLKERPFCVLATVSAAARPEAAFVAYSSNTELEIIIGTSNNSRKYENIVKNKSAALVVADSDGEVQYEGDVDVISGQDYEALMAAGRFEKLAGFDKYRDDPTQVYLRIHPTWIRFILHGDTDRVEEFTEFA
jgi:general stress protein 26